MEPGCSTDIPAGESERPTDFILRAYEKHKGGLFAYVVALVGDHAVAEDVLCEVFAKLIKDPALYSGHGKISSFLYVCARNNAFNWLKRQAKQVQYSEEFDYLIDLSRNGADLKDLRKLVNRALFSIPIKQRETIIMKTYDGLKFREIAEITGEPINTVIARYQYGVTKLRELLGEYKNGV